MDLEGQGLQLFYRGIGSYEIEKSLVIRHEAGVLNVAIATRDELVFANSVSLSPIDSHGSNPLIGYVGSRRSIEYSSVESTGNHCEEWLFVGNP